MPAPVIDQSIPLNFYGLEIRERHGYEEAYCAGCGSWVRIGRFYMGDRLVMRQIPHNPPCPTYEKFIEDWKNGVISEQ